MLNFDLTSLEKSNNLTMINLRNKKFLVPPSSRSNLSKDIFRGLVSLSDDITEEDIAPYYNQELSSIYSNCVTTYFDGMLINDKTDNATGGEAKVYFLKNNNGEIIASVTSHGGIIQQLDENYKTISNIIEGEIKMTYRLVSGNFQLTSIEASNDLIRNIIMGTRPNVPTHIQSITAFLNYEEKSSYQEKKIISMLVEQLKKLNFLHILDQCTANHWTTLLQDISQYFTNPVKQNDLPEKFLNLLQSTHKQLLSILDIESDSCGALNKIQKTKEKAVDHYHNLNANPDAHEEAVREAKMLARALGYTEPETELDHEAKRMTTETLIKRNRFQFDFAGKNYPSEIQMKALSMLQ